MNLTLKLSILVVIAMMMTGPIFASEISNTNYEEIGYSRERSAMRAANYPMDETNVSERIMRG